MDYSNVKITYYVALLIIFIAVVRNGKGRRKKRGKEIKVLRRQMKEREG
jgi:hypothetical protein